MQQLKQQRQRPHIILQNHRIDFPGPDEGPDQLFRRLAHIAIRLRQRINLSVRTQFPKSAAAGPDRIEFRLFPDCQRDIPPPLRFDVLEEVSRRLPGFPIVLHGASSVPQSFVKIINENGGKMPDAVGIPEEQLRHAAELSVCKINIDSDLRLAMTGTIREFFNEHPDKFDPREYLKPARANIKELVRPKLVDVLGCAGKA